MKKNSVNTQPEALYLADSADKTGAHRFAAELRRLHEENERLKAQQVLVAHPDDVAIDRFAAAMKAKMAKQRAKGYGGWEDKADCPTDRLQTMLVDHLPKGDPVDVGNFAMMLWNRGEHTAAPPPAQHLPDEVQLSKTSDLLPRLPEGNARGWWRDGKVNFENVHLPKSGAFELFTYNQMREYAAAAIESSRPPAHELEQTAQQQELVAKDWRHVIPGMRRTDQRDSRRAADYNQGWNDCQKKTKAELEKLYTSPPLRKPLADEKMRTEFESWVVHTFGIEFNQFEKSSDGTYLRGLVREYWGCWKAAHGIKEVCEALKEQSAQQEQIERTSVRSSGPNM